MRTLWSRRPASSCVGGYTTVLTFTLETLRLGREGAIALTRTNVAASVVAGNIALWLGALLARTL